MKNILIGFVLILLDFDFNFEGISIGLLPDFIGYYFLGEGIKDFLDKSGYFKKSGELIMPMLILSLILYCFDLFTITAAMGYFSLIFTAVSVGMALYITYQIIRGFNEMEIETKKLEDYWKVMLCGHVLWFLLSFVPAVAVLGGIAAIFVTVVFLLEFNNIKKGHENTLK